VLNVHTQTTMITAQEHQSCDHLESLSSEIRASILKRYRKVMSWCCSEDMRSHDPARRQNAVSHLSCNSQTNDLLTNSQLIQLNAPSCISCGSAVPRPLACLLCEASVCRNASRRNGRCGENKQGSCATRHLDQTGHALRML
jgi:hypothetical protein